MEGRGTKTLMASWEGPTGSGLPGAQLIMRRCGVAAWYMKARRHSPHTGQQVSLQRKATATFQ